MAKKIGICVATIEGGVVCHQEIGREATRRGIDYPEIITHTPRYDAFRKVIENDDLSELSAALSSSIGLLAAAGADFAIIPSNTMHLVFDGLVSQCSIPLLNIVAVAAEFCSAQGCSRVGILGTGSTMKRRLFDSELHKLGIDPVYPTNAEAETLNAIIARELVKGVFRGESVKQLVSIADRVGRSSDALILGCTELPLVLTSDNCSVPLVDTTRLLAHAALTAAVS
jgi:aspartate racemase